MQRIFSKDKQGVPVSQRINIAGSDPTPGKTSVLHQLHHALGNQAVQRLFKSGVIQAKLRVSASDDKYEQEANQVAEQVMKIPLPQVQTQQHDQEEEPELQRKPLTESVIQRLCPKCEEELQRQAEGEKDETLQTKPTIQHQVAATEEDTNKEQYVQTKIDSTQSTDLTEQASTQIESLQYGGQALAASERAFFEPRFRKDFSQVRIHNSNQSHDAARSIQARAFTLGNNITFNQGQYKPGSHAGRQLLAHELTHVVQQGGADSRPVTQGEQQDNNSAQQEYVQASPEISHAPRSAQRLGDLTQVPPDLNCPIPPSQAPGETDHVVFANAVNTLNSVQLLQLNNLVINWHASGANTTVRIDGYASTAGSDELNWRLSCQRAQVVANMLNHPASGITGIPSNFIEVYMQGETIEFGAVGNNRRVGIYMLSPNPTPPPTPGGCTTPTVVPGSPTPTLIGSRGGCGGGADFISHDFPGVPFALRMRTLYPNMQYLPDIVLETSMHTELSSFSGSMGTRMATHFDGGSGAPLNHGVGSALATAVAAAPTFTTLAAAIQTEIDNQVGAQLSSSCHIDWTAFTVLPPGLPTASFNVFSGDSLQLQAVLGGTQGLRVLIKDFNLNVASNTYSATIIIEICDDFGVDHTDMDPLNPGHGSPGLVSFWILQHERLPGHRAFINTVTVETPISGSI